MRVKRARRRIPGPSRLESLSDFLILILFNLTTNLIYNRKGHIDKLQEIYIESNIILSRELIEEV